MHAELARTSVRELVHRAELPGGVHVEQREGRHGRMEGLHREMPHHRAVLAGGIEHHRPLTPRDYLAQDVDALGLEPLEMAERGDPRQLASRRLPARSRPGGGAGLISGHGRQSGGSPAWLGSSLRDGVYGTEDGRAWPPNPPGGGGGRPDTPLMVETGHEKRPPRMGRVSARMRRSTWRRPSLRALLSAV